MSDYHFLLLLGIWSSLAILLAWTLPSRLQASAIAICGIGMLASVSTLSLLILAAGTGLSFLLHRQAAGKRSAVVAGVTGAVALFAWFMTAGERTAEGIGSGVLLPAGLAFYTLRLVHYLIESYKGGLRPHGFDEYLAYQFLPSALPVGPIHRFDEFLRDLRRRRWDGDIFSGGLERILYGSAKLVVVGNYLVGQKLAIALSGSMTTSGFEGVYTTALLFWIKLYVLFSGYSDIAIGFAALLGLGLRENFHWPFLARNIGEFWQRWHMSLASWCRDYVFTPALSFTRSHALAVLASMLVLGLWHEFSLRYLLWGAYHGLGLAAFRWFSTRAGPAVAALSVPLQNVWRVVATLLTLHFVLFSFAATSAIERVLLGR